jgi:hypothetical protein
MEPLTNDEGLPDTRQPSAIGEDTEAVLNELADRQAIRDLEEEQERL